MSEPTKKRPRANGRRKGHDFERHIAAALRPIWPEARRGAQSRSGTDAPDVEGTPYWIECKRGARPSITAACRQALAATDGRPVVVVIKDDRRPAFVLEDQATLAAYWVGPLVLTQRIRTVDLEAAQWVDVNVAGDVWLAMSLGYWLECCGLDRGGEG